MDSTRADGPQVVRRTSGFELLVFGTIGIVAGLLLTTSYAFKGAPADLLDMAVAGTALVVLGLLLLSSRSVATIDVARGTFTRRGAGILPFKRSTFALADVRAVALHSEIRQVGRGVTRAYPVRLVTSEQTAIVACSADDTFTAGAGLTEPERVWLHGAVEAAIASSPEPGTVPGAGL
jgi:hypothetical protein